jgi:hypothetical protein
MKGGRYVARPPDVRKVYDLPKSKLTFFWGYAPIEGAAQHAKESQTVGQSHHRTSGGAAEIRKPVTE